MAETVASDEDCNAVASFIFWRRENFTIFLTSAEISVTPVRSHPQVSSDSTNVWYRNLTWELLIDPKLSLCTE